MQLVGVTGMTGNELVRQILTKGGISGSYFGI